MMRVSSLTGFNAVLVAAIATTVFSGCGPDTASVVRPAELAGGDAVVKQAEEYVGDPWEARFRREFWREQHIHDSWNRCHLGEYVSELLRELSGC